MLRFVGIALVAFALVACGGGDDDDDSSEATEPPAQSVPTATIPASSGATPTPSGANTTPATSSETPTTAVTAIEPTATTPAADPDDNAGGAPTHASEDFPDVRVPLAVGSSAEVGSMDPNPTTSLDSRDENSSVKVTITDIQDPAEAPGSIFSPEPGNRWFAIFVTMEATGSSVANTGEWWLSTTDGTQYTNTFALGDVPEIMYGTIEAGTVDEGRIMFEIPEDAEVAWILMSPTIFLGENLVFVSE